MFGFNALGDPTFDDTNATGDDASLLGRIGVTSTLFDGTYRDQRVPRTPAGRPALHRSRSTCSIPIWRRSMSRYHSYRTDLQWNNTVHLNDFFSVPVLSATDLTFGYEYTADNINVK